MKKMKSSLESEGYWESKGLAGKKMVNTCNNLCGNKVHWGHCKGFPVEVKDRELVVTPNDTFLE